MATKGKSETVYLEDLARRIETLARTLSTGKAALMAIADDIRTYKENRYDGLSFENLNPDTAVAEAAVEAVCDSCGK